MANYLVLRLVPKEPETPGDFTDYLADLEFDVLDVSFASAPGGTSILTPSGFSEVVQHEKNTAPPLDPPVWELQSVATAVIEIDFPNPEYVQPDVVLLISRSGTEIARLALGYNVALLNQVDPPDPDPHTEEFRNIPAANVGAYVPISALHGIGFELPEDGSPPKYQDLLNAVEAVLNADPGSTTNLASLTTGQARHVASEIIWNRTIEPLPAPSSVEQLENMYKGADNGALVQFEAALIRFNAEQESQSELLAQYVFALSAAIFAHQEANQATRAGLRLPARPGEEPLPGKRREVDVILVQGP
jgi:hypothetical protein